MIRPISLAEFLGLCSELSEVAVFVPDPDHAHGEGSSIQASIVVRVCLQFNLEFYPMQVRNSKQRK